MTELSVLWNSFMGKALHHGFTFQDREDFVSTCVSSDGICDLLRYTVCSGKSRLLSHPPGFR